MDCVEWCRPSVALFENNQQKTEQGNEGQATEGTSCIGRVAKTSAAFPIITVASFIYDTCAEP